MEYTAVTEKLCTKCGATKPSAAFGANRSRKDGLAQYCTACDRAYMAEYRRANLEKRRESVRAWTRTNTAKNRARAHAWRLANPARHRANNLAWAVANPDKAAANTRKRDATKLRAIPTWANDRAIRVVYAKAKELSHVLGVKLHVDHVVPLKSPLVCGLHCEANLQLLEKAVNSAKGNHFWPDMPDETGIETRPY